MTEVAPVRGPAAVGDADAANAGFDETAGHQQLVVPERSAVALMPRRAVAVTFADGARFLLQIKGVHQTVRRQHLEGLPIRNIHPFHRCGIERAPQLIDRFEQVPTATEFILRQFAQAHEIDLIVLDLGAGMRGTCDAGPRNVVGAMLHRREQIDVGGDDRIGSAEHFRDDGAQVRLAFAARDVHAVAGRRLEAGMLVAQADNGADDCEFVHHAGEARQVFAHLDAGYARRNWPEFAANLVGGVGLHVE